MKSVLVCGLPATLVLAGLGAVHGTPRSSPVAEIGPAPLRSTLTGVGVAGTWFAGHPQAFLVTLLVVGVPVVLGWLVALLPRSVQTDPQRMFTSPQRQAGFDRAGGRCEMEGMFFFTRCRRDAAHGDHWFPWSKGGPTDMANFVAACVRCNTSKGAKVPTFWQTQRLAHRRRRYFAAHLDPVAGGRFEIPDRRVF